MPHLYQVKIRINKDSGIFHAAYMVAASCEDTAEATVRYQLEDENYTLTHVKKIAGCMWRRYLHRECDAVLNESGEHSRASIMSPPAYHWRFRIGGIVRAKHGRADVLRKVAKYLHQLADYFQCQDSELPAAGITRPRPPFINDIDFECETGANIEATNHGGTRISAEGSRPAADCM